VSDSRNADNSEEFMRSTSAVVAFVAVLPLALGGCSNLNRQQQRALSGGAIGAAGGAAIAVMTGGGALTGALIGGAGGAALGGLTNVGK
jgi:anti-sigma-K factor RskA